MSEADKIIESLKNSGKKVEEFYMSNKTSDKNVANIEDDVRIVKAFIDYAQEVIDDMEYERPVDVTVYQKYLTSMQSILAEREQDKKRIQELEEKMNADNMLIIYELKQKDKRIQELEEALLKVKDKNTTLFITCRNSIPKQVVIDKIKEYDKKMEEDAGHPNWVVTDRIVMNVLQELLEGRNENG